MRKMFFVYSYFSIFFVIFVESYEEGPGGKYHKQQFYEYHYEFPDSSSNKKPKLTLTYDYATHSNVRYHPRKNRYHIDDYSPNETEMDFEMKPLDGMGPPNFGVSDMQNTFMSFMKQFPFSRIFDDMGGFSPMDIRRRPRSRASTQHSPIHVHFHDHSGKYRMGVENTPKPIEPLDEEEEDAFVV